MSASVQTSTARQAHDRAQARAVHPAGTYVGFAEDELGDSPAKLFERQVGRTPDALAVVDDDGRWTYSELNKWANSIARLMLRESNSDDGRVGLLIGNSPTMVASVLAALKAGRTFVPVDPVTTPMERIRYILQDSGAELVLTTEPHLALAKGAGEGLKVLDVGALEGYAGLESPGQSPGADDIAWIIYTSGSTGQPKGVTQTCRNVVHFLATESAVYRICPDDRYAVPFSSSVNMWYRETLSALVKGATTYPVDMHVKGFVGLAKSLIEHEITIFALVPSLFRKFAETLSGPLPSLRVIKLVGEPTLRTDFDLYKRFFPEECILINRFGTTETAPVRYYFMDHESDVTDTHAPIGYPVPGSDLLLLDSHGVEVPPGEVGEIVIRSRYLATGYWDKPEITQVTFKPDPQDASQRLYMTGDMGLMRPDGCVVHLGRKDDQVQIRGYRVELAEIEMALRGIEEVEDAAVAALDDGGGGTYLVGYVVANGPSPSVSLLADQLSGKLPSYMIPGRWVFLDEFPRGPNGKLHRQGLPAPETIQTEPPDSFVEPATPMERRVARNWKKVLKDVDQIGVHDRFFDLGGESLEAMQVISWLEAETGAQLSPIDMARQTLGQIASFYQSHQTRGSGESSGGWRGLPRVIARRIFGTTASRQSEPD